MLCGELNADILHNLESTLSQIYTPLLSKQDEWGQLKASDEKQMFLHEMNRFDDELKRKIANLRGDVELVAPPANTIAQKPAEYAKAAERPELVQKFMETMHQWCQQITEYLHNDPSQHPLHPDVNSGPDVEIEYWSRRLLSLISITEQLKDKSNRVVTGVLKA